MTVRRASKPRGSYRKPDDEDLLPLVRRLVDERPTYGYRRITALANRELARTGEPAVNHKRMFRIMRQSGMLLVRHTLIHSLGLGCRPSRDARPRPRA